MFIVVLFTIAKRWKQPRGPSVDEWISQLSYIHAIKYSAMKRNENEILIHATTWINLKNILSEKRDTKGLYYMIPLK